MERRAVVSGTVKLWMCVVLCLTTAGCLGDWPDCPWGAEKQTEEQVGTKVREWCQKEGGGGEPVMTGPDRYWSLDGELIASVGYDDGELDGEIFITDPATGSELRQGFREGEPDGEGHIRVVVEEEPYTLTMEFREGLRHGEWAAENRMLGSDVRSIHRYERGKLTGLFEVFQDGSKVYSCPYEQGALHGKAKVKESHGLFEKGVLVEVATGADAKSLVDLCSVGDPPHYQLDSWRETCPLDEETCALVIDRLSEGTYEAPKQPSLAQELKEKLDVDTEEEDPDWDTEGLGKVNDETDDAESSVTTKLSLGSPKMTDACDERNVRDEFASKTEALRYCYEKEARKNPTLDGKVVPVFEVARDGSVSKASVTNSTLKNKRVEGCIARVIKRARFSKLEQNGCRVEYPLAFSSDGGGGFDKIDGLGRVDDEDDQEPKTGGCSKWQYQFSLNGRLGIQTAKFDTKKECEADPYREELRDLIQDETLSECYCID